jgi:predicted ribosome-associated RNA-binding protein Tma20
MSLLPKNECMEKNITPKVFFIWGQSMHGKTYLAKQFPSPIILNTDGNGKKIDTPHVDIEDFEKFVAVLKEIEEGKHTFKTIVIDLVDDIKTFMEDYICKKYEVENLADAPFGKAFNDVKSTWKRLMIRLTQLPYTVIFISHIIQIPDEYDKNTMIDQPSLEQKYLNMTKGRTDVMIKCQKIGKTYLQICNEKRDLYKKADFKDEAILKTLENVKQLFEDNKPQIQDVSKEVKPIKKKETNIPVVTNSVVELTDEQKAQNIVDGGETKAFIEGEKTFEPQVVEIKPLKKKSLLIKKEEE